MARHVSVGIDIGSSQVRVVVASAEGNTGAPKILGTGMVESKGLHHGYIVNIPEVERAVRAAAAQAQKVSGIKIKKAFLSIGGVGVEEAFSRGETVISRADSEITDLEIEKVLETCEKNIPAQYLLNRKIIYTIPLRFVVDGSEAVGRSPVGMRGMKLEARALFITCLTQHLNDLVHAVEGAGVEVEDVMAAPIAASFVTLGKQQKMAGCVLANIGSETTSIVVFENGIPVSLKVFPMGGTAITNDIALALKISLEEAELIKRGGITATTYPRKKLEDVISARLTDIFELVENHLKKMGKNGLLPAGIILTGGSSGITTIGDLAKGILKLPSRVGTIFAGEGMKAQLKDSTWAVAYGLCMWGFRQEEDVPRRPPIMKEVGRFFRQFLP